ncbi:hypothetical protein WA026_015038 [Henosepilachna vigintioctopunctata]|uniref:Aminopeptidase n=1 Tax=Henosepilachna vigintioctopunctata TaxID=420089 RepID=A0AAW1U9V8_9CUCU
MIHLCEEESYARLPVIIEPTHYEISLIVNLSKHEFEGDVMIYINVMQRTKQVHLHSLDLEIENVKLLNASGECVEPESTVFSAKHELLKLFFNKPLPTGIYCLKIQYEGSLMEDPRGMFLCKFFKLPEREKISVFTHFEPAYARKCFPCWDEPAFKATFKLNITVSEEYTAVSNMPVECVEKLGKNRKYHFLKTPMMSTYHLAFVLGQFTYIEVLTSDNKLVRINTLDGKEKQAKCALDMAVNALSFYTEYFNIPYPFRKLDFVVCPNYGFDTMGNWGLIICREINIFTDPETPLDIAEKFIALGVNHQIAHQWLGNLVTMQWWSQFWFQEAMTQFAEYVCYDYTFPNGEIWNDFVLQFLHTAFCLDESKQSHSVKKAIKTANEVEKLYDGINYNKGVSLIRMLNWYVGDDSFKKALFVYLSTYGYTNATPDSFYLILEEISKKPVVSMMSTWLKQPGFPVVKISMAPGCDCKLNRSGVTLHLVQSRFGSSNTQKKSDTDIVLWKIPICVRTANKEEIKLLLEEQDLKMFLPNVNSDDWIKLNPGAVGYYRVHYSPELITKIGTAITNGAIPVLDRLIILDDLFHMVKYEYTSITEIMEILSAFENDREFLVWSAISRIISKLMIFITNSSIEDHFNKFQRKLLDNAPHINGTSKVVNFENFLEELVLGQKSWLVDNDIIHQTKKLFADAEDSNEKLPNDMKIAFYRTIVKTGCANKFYSLMKLYKTVDTHEERRSICNNLSNSIDEKLLRKFITFVMLNEADPIYTYIIVMAITYAKTAKDYLWEYYKTNWKDILDKNNKDSLSKIIEEIKDKYARDCLAVEIETFLERTCPGSKSALESILEILKYKSACIERDSEETQKFLSPY